MAEPAKPHDIVIECNIPKYHLIHVILVTSITIRPTGWPSAVISKNTFVLAILSEGKQKYNFFASKNFQVIKHGKNR